MRDFVQFNNEESDSESLVSITGKKRSGDYIRPPKAKRTKPNKPAELLTGFKMKRENRLKVRLPKIVSEIDGDIKNMDNMFKRLSVEESEDMNTDTTKPAKKYCQRF